MKSTPRKHPIGAFLDTVGKHWERLQETTAALDGFWQGLA